MRNYEMFSVQGNAQVQKAIDDALSQTKFSEGKEKLIENLKAAIKIRCKNHPEVYDTEPFWHIADEINERTGFKTPLHRFEI